MQPKDPSVVWMQTPAGESSEQPGAATKQNRSEFKLEMPPKGRSVVRSQSLAGESP